MFRKSRLAVFAFLFFFFQAGLLGAYVRCLERWPVSWDRSETAKEAKEDWNYGDGVLHCPEGWNGYRLIQAQNSLKKDPRTDRVKGAGSQTPSCVVMAYSSLANYTDTSRPFSLSLSCSSPYPSVPIYQSKVVYRI